MHTITVNNLVPKAFCGGTMSKKYGGRIFNVPSLLFSRGCRVCIQDVSGSGKSSFLNFIYGLRHDYVGEIVFDSENISTFSQKKWSYVRTRCLSYLPQGLNLFPELTVSQNIQLKNDLTHHKSSIEILSLLEQLNVADKFDVPVSKLSLGQQQRVAIVRALCQPFDFLLLDEPVSHLDDENNDIVARVIEAEASKQGAGVISTSVGNQLKLSYTDIIAL